MGATSIYNRSANGRTLSQPGNTGRSYRGSHNPSTGSGRSFSAPSTGGRNSSAALGAAVFLETPRAAGGLGGSGGGGYGGGHGGGGGPSGNSSEAAEALEALAEEVPGEVMVEVAVSPETPKAAGALEALAEEVTGEAMVEVTGKLKE